MSTPNDDGGPAFPSEPRRLQMQADGSMTPVGYHGMSLRDWFAGQALPALLARASVAAVKESTDATGEDIEAFFAGAAYDLADAMLTERAKRNEGEE